MDIRPLPINSFFNGPFGIGTSTVGMELVGGGNQYFLEISMVGCDCLGPHSDPLGAHLHAPKLCIFGSCRRREVNRGKHRISFNRR